MNTGTPRQLSVLLSISLSGCAVTAGAQSDEKNGEIAARTESALCKNALSPRQEATALKLIDDICGDTWCEGDNNFAFDRLTCNAANSTCTLSLRIIPREENAASYRRACTTSGFLSFDSLVATAQNGYQSLNWDYYLALTDCINRLEAELR
jgi:hypothetical protein